MEWLADETGETVNLAVLEGHEAVNLSQADGRHIVGVGSWAGRRTALHCTANGKILLAFAQNVEVPPKLERFTHRTITTRPELLAELRRVRRRGYATNVGELETGLHAVAVPIADAAGSCRAALSVSGPAYRLPAASLEGIAGTCREAADAIEGLLGRRPHAA
jgi:DNA-binding IclR family transcriptional regulator